MGVWRRRHQMHRLPALRRGLQARKRRPAQRAPVPHLGRALCPPRGRGESAHRQPAGPGEHRGLRFGEGVSLCQPLQGCEGGKGFLRAQAVQPLHPSGLRAGVPDRRHLQDQGRRGADRPRVLHRLPLLRAGLPLRRALSSTRKKASPTNAPGAITASPRVCSPLASRSARSARAFSAISKDKQSPISLFIRNNRVQVLRPETGNAPNVFYVGIDKEVN